MNRFYLARVALMAAIFFSEGNATKIFDGTPKTIVYISNSHGGGKYLKDRVNRYQPGDAIEFVTLSGWGMGLDDDGNPTQWLTPGKYDLTAYTQPVIFIAMSGLPSCEGSEDLEGREAGADKIERMLSLTKEIGADVVFASTYHYFPSNPEALTEKYVAETYNDREVRSGTAVDVVHPSKEYYPVSLRDDLYHPSKTGHHIYSHVWFKALLEHDGIDEIPGWSLEMIEEEYQAELARRSVVSLVSPNGGDAFHVGDEIEIAFSANCDLVSQVTLALSFSMHQDSYIIDTVDITCTPDQRHSYRFTIPETVNVDGRTHEIVKKEPVNDLIIFSATVTGREKHEYDYSDGYTAIYSENVLVQPLVAQRRHRQSLSPSMLMPVLKTGRHFHKGTSAYLPSGKKLSPGASGRFQENSCVTPIIVVPDTQ